MTRRSPVPEAAVASILTGIGVLNLAPAVLAVLPQRLPQAYGVTPESAETELLLRHRAVLLGLVGAALTTAARVPAWRAPALVGAAVSKLAFLALAGKPPNAELRRVARADALALGLLSVVAVDELAGRPR